MSKLELIDTHCHIHDSEMYKDADLSADQQIVDAKKAGVKNLVCVGTDVTSSREAVNFCKLHLNCYASVALHPHEAEKYSQEDLDNQMMQISELLENKANKLRIVAIGECGLDYYYHDDLETHRKQDQLLRQHIKLAQKFKLPLIFHIRNPKNQDSKKLGNTFNEFFKIIDSYQNITGVVHSFSAGQKELEGIVSRGLYVGLNGIMTFTRDESQLAAAKSVPLNKLMLETDAPFLTPSPFRGKMCQPKHVCVTAEFLSKLRGENIELLSQKSTLNAKVLFGIN